MPQPDEIQYIHDTYFQIVNAGVGLPAQREGLSRLAHTLMERDRVEAVILAGTDLALLFNESNTDFPHVDAARVHIDAIANRALGAR
jgi:aspartate racemase